MNSIRLYGYVLTLSQRLQLGLLCISYVMVICTGFGLFLYERIDLLFTEQRELAQLNDTLAYESQEIKKHAQYALHWHEITQTFASPSDLSHALAVIEALVHEAHLELLSLNVGANFTASVHEVYPLEVIIRGEYAQLLEFIRVLNGLNFLSDLDFQLKSAPARIQAFIKVNIFLGHPNAV